MAEEKTNNQKSETLKWVVGSLIALLAAGSRVAAMIQIFLPKSDSTPQSPYKSNFDAGAENSDNPQPKPTRTRSSNNKNKSPENKDFNSGEANTFENNNPVRKIECQVSGKVSDNNKVALSGREIIFVGTKDNEIYLTVTGDNGEFRADCSHISQEDFPGKLKVKGNSLNWGYKPSILLGGQENINIYIPIDVLNKAKEIDWENKVWEKRN